MGRYEAGLVPVRRGGCVCCYGCGEYGENADLQQTIPILPFKK